MYTTQRFTASISVDEYLEKYVNVSEFLEYCKACHNYEKIWSCPSYDFDVLEYWKKYKIFDLTAIKIIFDDNWVNKKYLQEELNEIMDQSLVSEKKQLSEELLKAEAQFPDSISLSAGSCSICGDRCPRTEKEPCRFPQKMRYSIESLGGNVGLTISRLMGLTLEWMEEGKLPPYFVLVSGLLHN